jgi:putative membrane protein
MEPNLRASALASIVSLVLAFSGPAAALPLIRLADADMPNTKPSHASDDTSHYVKDAADGDAFEIAAAKLARTRAANPDVKDYAELMINDHVAIGNDLKATVWQSNLDVAIPSSLDDKHAQMLRELGASKPQDFDRRYMQQQILAQDEAVRVHTFYGDSGDNRLLREFANETGPKVEAHLALARHVALSVGAMQAAR